MKPVVDDFTVKEFRKDVKKLCKKYKHLEGDLKRALKVLKAEPVNESRAPQVAHLGKDVRIPVDSGWYMPMIVRRMKLSS